MRRIRGKEVLEDIAELVTPRHTALLVFDMQNDFCAPGGNAYDHSGESAHRMRQIIGPIAQLLKAARRHGILTVFTLNTHLPDSSDESGPFIRHLLRHGIPVEGKANTVKGTWGHQVIDELRPLPGDILVEKYSYSAFQSSFLDKILRVNHIKTIIIVGGSTYLGVLTTARAALYHDYYVVVPKQCVEGTNPELHEAAMKLLEAELYNLEDILHAWRGSDPTDNPEA